MLPRVKLTCPYCSRPVPTDLQPVTDTPLDYVGRSFRTSCCKKLVEWELVAQLTKTTQADGMKVIIAGSRTMPISHFPIIAQAIEKSGYKVAEVVCGMAKGADVLGGKWAVDNGIPVKRMPAEWNKYGKQAGFIRNAAMAQYADALIVFIYENSAGSMDMLKRMNLLKKPTFPIYDGEIDYAF